VTSLNEAQSLHGFEARPEPGRSEAIALSALVHLVLIVVLFIGVRWQSSAPSTVTVELWEPQPPLPAAVLEAPKPEPVAPPKPTPEVKPEPRIEKPDIALKAPPKPKVKPKEEKKPKPQQPKAKVEAKPAAPDESYERELRAELQSEEARLEAARQADEVRQLGQRAEQQARLRSAALAKEQNDYIARITAKVRGNWILPAMEGNPEAVFLVTQLPTGEVLDVKLTRSSGLPAYDAAVERAILKSSPLPLPRSRELFSRELKLTFKPHD